MKLKSIALAMSAVTLSFSSFASLIITSQPDNASPTVSASGGNVPFDRSLQNSGSSALSLRVYDYLVFPDGSIYNRSNASNIGLNAGSSVIQTGTYISVPSEFKYGTYQYVYAAYDRNSGEVSTSSFEFTKEPGANDILQSCKAILDAGASVGDGSYHIDPDNDPATAPVEVYCDMTTDGGGWTLISKYSGAFETPCNYQSESQCNIDNLKTDDHYSDAKLSDNEILSISTSPESEFRAVGGGFDVVIKREDGAQAYADILSGEKAAFSCRDVYSNEVTNYQVHNDSSWSWRVTTATNSIRHVTGSCGNRIFFSVDHPNVHYRQGYNAGLGQGGKTTIPGVFYVR